MVFPFQIRPRMTYSPLAIGYWETPVVSRIAHLYRVTSLLYHNTKKMDADSCTEMQEVPEIDFSVNVQPYMFEPMAKDGYSDASSSENEESEEEFVPEVEEVPSPSEW